jgi:hypothetical protein
LVATGAVVDSADATGSSPAQSATAVLRTGPSPCCTVWCS